MQEFITHTHELRVYVVGNELISYIVSGKGKASSIWDTPDQIIATATSLPADVLGRIRVLAKHLKVEIGSVDFLCSPHGDLVFLEVNYVTDWRYFEALAGDRRVSDAAIAHFSDGD